MPKKEAIRHSILIVSASEQFPALVKRSLTDYITLDTRKSVALARRSLLEKSYDLVLINAPLPDETGEMFALDVTDRSSASVLLCVPRDMSGETSAHVTDHGVLVLPKPAPQGSIDGAVRFLTAIQNRMHGFRQKIQATEEKLEELRLVSKAKLLLMQKKQMTEDDAHRYIGKEAMDRGVSRKRIAAQILEELSE